MSSINQYFTFNYSQPSDYHFSHDSIFLARRVFELTSPKQIPLLKALDICSGCGIIGLDFIFHAQKEFGLAPLSMDFMEVQNIYESHFKTNQKRLGPTTTELHYISNNYNLLSEEKFKNQYNLILCNPPYFFPTKGVLSPSEFKNRCRFYIDSTFSQLLLGITNTLYQNGKAFLLLRDLPEHRWSAIDEAQNILRGRLKLDRIGDIRGTHLICLTKDSI